jgi:DNA-binding transcriptional LysR family regulator
MRHIDPAVLRAFLAVAETGGMTSAARQLNLTQAAVSQQIRRLEEQLGRRLLERGRGAMRVTADGERLLPRAQRLLVLNDEVMALMTTPEHEGEVRLGVPHDIVSGFLPPVLKSFDRAWPRVRVSLEVGTTHTLLAALERGEVDLTLGTERAPAPEAVTIAYATLIWVGAPGGQAHLQDPLPVALGQETCAFRRPVIEALRAAGRDWRSVCASTSWEVLCATVEADLGIMPVLAPTVPPRLEPITGTALPPLPVFQITLYLPSAGARPPARELARHIQEAFARRASIAA